MQINASTLHLHLASLPHPNTHSVVLVRAYNIFHVQGIEYPSMYCTPHSGTRLRTLQFQFVLPPPCPCITENVSDTLRSAKHDRLIHRTDDTYIFPGCNLFEPYIAAQAYRGITYPIGREMRPRAPSPSI